MKKEIMNNSDLHFEHKQWRSELSFWEDELKTFVDGQVGFGIIIG